MQTGEQQLGWNLDAFVAPTEDPYLAGQLGALNALSDLHVKGVAPRFAMALLGIPGQEPPETLYQLMMGLRKVLDAEGISLVGGHTLRTTQLLVGLTVMGEARSRLRAQKLASAGEVLVLTRPLGTGILLRADGMGKASGVQMQSLFRQLLRSQASIRVLLDLAGVSAAADVTGFGLVVHLLGMLKISGLSAEINLSSLPVWEGVEPLLQQKVQSTFYAQNARNQRFLSFSLFR